MADPECKVEIGTLIAKGVALIVVGQARLIEEMTDDPAERWRLLRTALERFARQRSD